jgi:adenylate cyclase
MFSRAEGGNRIRITAQLIDGSTGNHVWADRYDRELTDIFDLQDEGFVLRLRTL